MSYTFGLLLSLCTLAGVLPDPRKTGFTTESFRILCTDAISVPDCALSPWALSETPPAFVNLKIICRKLTRLGSTDVTAAACFYGADLVGSGVTVGVGVVGVAAVGSVVATAVAVAGSAVGVTDSTGTVINRVLVGFGVLVTGGVHWFFR
jgi:hypothetical protein